MTKDSQPPSGPTLASVSGSATYNPKACCGSDYWAFGDGKGQCWGKVEFIDSMGDDPDGGEMRVHACQVTKKCGKTTATAGRNDKLRDAAT